MSERRLLGYCGMYCGDCLGCSGVIADASKEFLKVLDNYEFEKTAIHVFHTQLEEYDKFIDMLEFMGGLRCKTRCREVDGGESKCEVRQCALDHGYFTCNECEGFEECDKLENVLGDLHLESCKNNLRGINKLGLDTWLREGKIHHYWDKE